MSATTHPSETGMTAQAAKASTTDTSGASRNTPLLALAGMIGSLRINLKKSANGWRMPHGPTTFGPRRSWNRAQDFSLNVDKPRRRQEQADEQHEALDYVANRRPDIARVHPMPDRREIAASYQPRQNGDDDDGDNRDGDAGE